jgi:hypothetical protein
MPRQLRIDYPGAIHQAPYELQDVTRPTLLRSLRSLRLKFV